jgi:hypothetical protein
MWDHMAAIIAACGGAAAAIMSAVNRKKINELHVLVNSRLTQLLEQTGKASFAEGRQAGMDSEKK